ncbi:MAG: glutamate racemase [Nitrospinota bacterium]
MINDARPIGIFDSGIGGLTVLREIEKLLPVENLIYLGDTARVPYGTKSSETVIRYSLENGRFLLSMDVKAIVVACNSASAVSIPELRSSFNIPILGVIEAGVEEAMHITNGAGIGVIGTHATIESGRYDKLLKQKGAKNVISKACPLFVPLAEEGWTDNPVAEQVARIYLEPFKGNGVDTLILGCTHYPLLQGVIGKVCGPGVALVNSARAAALKLKQTLEENGLLNEDGGGNQKFYVTDSEKRAQVVGSRFLGRDLSNQLEKADLTEFSHHG